VGGGNRESAHGTSSASSGGQLRDSFVRVSLSSMRPGNGGRPFRVVLVPTVPGWPGPKPRRGTRFVNASLGRSVGGRMLGASVFASLASSSAPMMDIASEETTLSAAVRGQTGWAGDARWVAVASALAWTLGCSRAGESPLASAVGPQSTKSSPAVTAQSSAGQPTPPAARPTVVGEGRCPTSLVIDDLEDGDATILVAEERAGSWSTYVDKEGSTVSPAAGTRYEPAAPGANGSSFAAHMKGRTSSKGNPYAGMGVTLTSDHRPYDLSCCKAVSFVARRGEGSLDTVRFKVGDANTVPEGGACKQCYNDFGVDLGLTKEWKRYSIAFESMKQQPYWGDPYPRVDPSGVYHLHFQVNHPDFDYDIWVDDLRLEGCDAR
jgi:hypothetical protein